MKPSDRLLQRALTFQGLLYLATNVWALIATRNFLSYTNPQADIFETRSFAALATVIAIYFLVGAWRQDLLRPAAFLGLGSAVAIVLVEIFHLPAIGWATLLWIDLLLEVALAAGYISLFFFRREEKDAEPTKNEGDILPDAAAPVSNVIDDLPQAEVVDSAEVLAQAEHPLPPQAQPPMEPQDTERF